jgi:hypothetical protein
VAVPGTSAEAPTQVGPDTSWRHVAARSTHRPLPLPGAANLIPTRPAAASGGQLRIVHDLPALSPSLGSRGCRPDQRGADEEVHRGRGGGGQPAAVSLSKLSAGNGATGITAASLNGRSDTTRDWFIF